MIPSSSGPKLSLPPPQQLRWMLLLMLLPRNISTASHSSCPSPSTNNHPKLSSGSKPEETILCHKPSTKNHVWLTVPSYFLASSCFLEQFQSKIDQTKFTKQTTFPPLFRGHLRKVCFTIFAPAKYLLQAMSRSLAFGVAPGTPRSRGYFSRGGTKKKVKDLESCLLIRRSASWENISLLWHI